jgi:hypothetical protein
MCGAPERLPAHYLYCNRNIHGSGLKWKNRWRWLYDALIICCVARIVAEPIDQLLFTLGCWLAPPIYYILLCISGKILHSPVSPCSHAPSSPFQTVRPPRALINTRTRIQSGLYIKGGGATYGLLFYYISMGPLSILDWPYWFIHTYCTYQVGKRMSYEAVLRIWIRIRSDPDLFGRIRILALINDSVSTFWCL